MLCEVFGYSGRTSASLHILDWTSLLFLVEVRLVMYIRLAGIAKLWHV